MRSAAPGRRQPDVPERAGTAEPHGCV